MNDQQSSKEKLLELLKPGDTVYTILRHVSRSGMSRVIDLVIMSDSGPRSISGWAAEVCNNRIDRDRWGIKISGAGMDMGFALVYGLSYALFKDGFTCIGKGCPANDHSNDHLGIHPNRVVATSDDNVTGVLDEYDPRRKHSDPGYALRQRWL